MGNTAIRVDNLGKMYRIGALQDTKATLSETISKTISAPFRRVSDILHGQAYGAAGLTEIIWALQDVSFSVRHGEVVGIAGANGAGKSTLLKLLSRVTKPTTGSMDIYGRIGALLEVGTGFHPELTGRENIYLNGAILGMGRTEIARKFDEIVEFAGIPKFIDTPVKYYSSGMKLRLGFAVAAHLEPDILVVDEVLAVGDAEFQRKCLGKMSDVAGEGRTVLFVSHNMVAVKQLCTRGILLQSGTLIKDGPVDEVVNYYLSLRNEEVAAVNIADRTDREGGETFRFTGVTMTNQFNEPVQSIPAGDPAQFLIDYIVPSGKPVEEVSVVIGIDDLYNQRLFTLGTRFTRSDFRELPPQGRLRCWVDTIPLLRGEYKVYLWAGVNNQLADRINDTLRFTVDPFDVFDSGYFPDRAKHGIFFVPHSWELADGEPAASVRES